MKKQLVTLWFARVGYDGEVEVTKAKFEEHEKTFRKNEGRTKILSKSDLYTGFRNNTAFARSRETALLRLSERHARAVASAKRNLEHAEKEFASVEKARK